MALSTSPSLLIDQFSSLGPRVFVAASTLSSSQVADTGRWAGCGENSKGSGAVGMRLYDLLCHTAATGTSLPGRVSWHSVIASTANGSTTLSSAFSTLAWDVSVSNSTST